MKLQCINLTGSDVMSLSGVGNCIMLGQVNLSMFVTGVIGRSIVLMGL